MGILSDVFVKVVRLNFLINFVVLNYDIDHEIPIILKTPFLATKKPLVYMECGKIKFQMLYDEVSFHVCKTKKQPIELEVVSMIDVVDKGMDVG